MTTAKIICDSISPAGIRLTTFELCYPRITHSELMTHCMLARNAASSRAIPFNKMQEQLTGIPARFGAANKGMQDGGDHDNSIHGRENVYDDDWTLSPQEAWNAAKEDAIFWSKAFYEAGYHKQVYNRLTECFQQMKTIVTATEWANWFWLRNDEDADPTLHDLASKMYAEYKSGIPVLLQPGEWHLPYVEARMKTQQQEFHLNGETLTTRGAIKVSAARCAAVSYRNEDYTLDKCLEVYDRLVGSDRKHASAFEHQASPIDWPLFGINAPMKNIWHIPSTWEEGITHSDRNNNLWSAKFKGWIQYRKLIPGENYEGEI